MLSLYDLDVFLCVIYLTNCLTDCLIKSHIEFLIDNCQASAQLQNKSEFWPCVHFSHSSRMLWDPKILNTKLDIIEVKLVWIWIAVKDLSNIYLLKIVISLALEGNCW